MNRKSGPLVGMRILDLTDERGLYGAKLLADLGADVVRPEPPGGDPLRARGPHLRDSPGPTSSLWYAFFASNRRFAAIDLESDEGREQLRGLVDWADVVLDCGDLDRTGSDAESWCERRPELVVVRTSSFGPDGPWRDYLAPDLVAGALGGFCATTGDVDTPPLKGFGELNFMVSGAYVATAALAATAHVHQSGEGQIVDVSVHECIVSCLEQVLMFYWYRELLGGEGGPVLPRRGSLHWSNAYVVMPAVGGSIMITPTPNIEAQVAWLAEEGVHGDLLDEKYQKPEHLALFLPRLMQILRRWVAGKDVEAFFFEAQRRHSPYGWVLGVDRVANNPQLRGRDWWGRYRLGEDESRGPGAPYHFSDTPWSMDSHGAPGRDTEEVLAEIGWED